MNVRRTLGHSLCTGLLRKIASRRCFPAGLELLLCLLNIHRGGGIVCDGRLLVFYSWSSSSRSILLRHRIKNTGLAIVLTSRCGGHYILAAGLDSLFIDLRAKHATFVTRPTSFPQWRALARALGRLDSSFNRHEAGADSRKLASRSRSIGTRARPYWRPSSRRRRGNIAWAVFELRQQAAYPRMGAVVVVVLRHGLGGSGAYAQSEGCWRNASAKRTEGA